MWKCDDCGEVFSEPEYYEDYAEYDNGVAGAWMVACCPRCGGSEINEGSYDEEREEE